LCALPYLLYQNILMERIIPKYNQKATLNRKSVFSAEGDRVEYW
jgi:hypothetical protein